MDVMQAYAQGLSDAELLEFTERNLVASQLQVMRAEARRRGLHGFAHIDQSSPEMCLCGTVFVEGYHLDTMKRAHLEAVSNG